MTTSRTLISSLTLALFVSGCAIGPDYHRPESVLPEGFGAVSHAPNAAATEEVAVNPEWWRLFNDRELDRLVALALANNQDLVAASARMEAAEAAAREAGSDYFPDVDLSASSNRTRTSAETASGQQMGAMLSTNRRVALSINYELDLWGRIRRQNETVRAQALSSRFARDALTLSLAGMVTTEYLTLRMLDAELDAAMDTLSSWLKTERIVQVQFEEGLASEMALKQAIAAHAGAQAQWVELRRQRDLTENRLALLVGQMGLTVLRSHEQGTGRNREFFRRIPLPPMPPLGLPSSLLEARPDVRQAEENLVAANASIGLAKSAYFPTIGLTGFMGSESAEFSKLFTAPARIWSFGAALVMPIFNAGRTGDRVDQASARQKEALANYQKAVQTAFTEVKDALANLNYYQKSTEALEAQVNAARDTDRLAMARYEIGYSSFLEPLDSRRTLAGAELAYLAAHRNYLIAAVDFFKAMGGGWHPDVEVEARGESVEETVEEGLSAPAAPSEKKDAPKDATGHDGETGGGSENLAFRMDTALGQ